MAKYIGTQGGWLAPLGRNICNRGSKPTVKKNKVNCFGGIFDSEAENHDKT